MSAAEPKPSLIERLFADHRGALQTFFLRRIRSKADAADLAQEVYVRMLRISNQEAIRNPVNYLYTVANNLVKEHAVLDRRQADGIDIDEAPAHERLETLPEFDGDLDASQRVARLGVVTKAAPSQMPRGGGATLHTGTLLPGNRDASRGVPADGEEVSGQALVIVDAGWRDWVESMSLNEDQLRTLIAEQAAEWFVSTPGGLYARDSAAFTRLAQDISRARRGIPGPRLDRARSQGGPRQSRDSLESIVARARTAEDEPVQPLWPRVSTLFGAIPFSPLAPGGSDVAACVGLCLGLLSWWHFRPLEPPSGSRQHNGTSLRDTAWRTADSSLADASSMHLNTDTAVTISTASRTARDAHLRRGRLRSGPRTEALVSRDCRVGRGIDIGTQFDVRSGA